LIRKLFREIKTNRQKTKKVELKSFKGLLERRALSCDEATRKRKEAQCSHDTTNKMIDFRNPSVKMVEEANRRDLDLSNPQILKMIEGIQSKQKHCNVLKKWNGTQKYVALCVVIAGLFLNQIIRNV
jgi:hypothetical protein